MMMMTRMMVMMISDDDNDDDISVGIFQGGGKLWGTITTCRDVYAERCEFDQGVTRHAYTGIANETWEIIMINNHD